MQTTRWLITGVSAGLGRALAEEALGRGWSVAGTVRRAEDAEAFAALAPGRARAYLLDVADGAAAEAVVGRAAEDLGGLDIVVNNAGYGLMGALEECTDEQIRRQFEVNVFGAMAVTRAALPILREQASGLLMQISSQTGRFVGPGLSVYGASKWALEGFSEGLSRELMGSGVRVLIVEPGPFRTAWAGASMEYAAPMDEYAYTVDPMRLRLTALDGRQPGDPARAAAILCDVAGRDELPLRLPLGRFAIETTERVAREAALTVEQWGDLPLEADYPE
jgi:NAD(P)-dependent dehydrogenase (short-subunit alcohol dehydrogenase family)